MDTKRTYYLLLLAAAASIIAFPAFGSAEQGLKNTLPENFEITPPASDMPPVPIDGIDVPHDVLTYAQLAYQGYAVTQARESAWNGEKAYQLRIDNDSNPDDIDGLYLLYSLDWKLITEQAMYAPLPDPRPPVDTKKKEKPRESNSGEIDKKPHQKPTPGVGGENPDDETVEPIEPDKPIDETTPNPEPDTGDTPPPED